MKKEVKAFVQRQKAILTYKHNHSFIFFSKKQFKEITVLSLISFVLLFIFEVTVGLGYVETIYFICIILIPYIIYYYIKHTKEEYIDLNINVVVIQQVLKYLFTLSLSFLFVSDIYTNRISPFIVLLNIIFLVTLSIYHFIIWFKHSLILRFLIQTVIAIAIYFVFSVSVNVICVDSLNVELLLILVFVTISFLASNFLSIYPSRYIVHRLLVILFILSTPLFLRSNDEDEFFKHSNYLNFTKTNYPESFNQMIEWMDYTYFVSYDTLYIYQDKKLISKTNLSGRFIFLYPIEDTLYLHTMDSTAEEGGYTKLYSIDKEELVLVFESETNYVHNTPPIIIGDQYIYMNYNRFGWNYDLYSIDINTKEEMEYIPEHLDESYFLVDYSNYKIRIDKDWERNKCQFVTDLTYDGIQFGRLHGKVGFNTSIVLEAGDILEDLYEINYFHYNDTYLFARVNNKNTIYNRKTGEIQLLDEPITDIIETEGYTVIFTYNNKLLLYKGDDLIQEVIVAPGLNYYTSVIRLSNSDRFFYKNYEITFNDNNDIIEYGRINQKYKQTTIFISSLLFATTAFGFSSVLKMKQFFRLKGNSKSRNL